MLLGRFESAWRESDAIASRGKPDVNRFWDGRPLAGKRVLVRCLHGLGDTLQYIRYAPLIRQTAARLIVEAQPALKRLLVAANIADEVITWGDPEPVWHQQVEIVELPRIFRTTLASIPNEVPYLHLPGAARPQSGVLRVGLLWRSSDYNPRRSIPLPLLARICSTPGVEFFSFQPDPGRADLQTASAPICDFAPSDCCILETGKRLQTLDLLITVDTMLAHLAGALGIRTWTLLPFEGDWRWMLDRSDSPWYPQMRLFRQPTPDDWTSVVDAIERELANVYA